jgi:TolB protein
MAASLAAACLLAAFAWLRGGTPARDGAPHWSPSGQQVVFHREEGGGLAGLFVVHADGTGARRLFEAATDDRSPAFSPDGTRVAFVSRRDGNPEIYVADVAAGGARRLTTSEGDDLSPAWAPDGNSLVFVSNRAGADFGVFRVGADGSGLVKLTDSGRDAAPQVSPDGSRLAFIAAGDVHVLDLSTNDRVRLTAEPTPAASPTWSPDAARLAFVSYRNGRAEVFTMNADGSDQRPLVTMPTGDAVEPRWSPDGRHVAFVHVGPAPGGGTDEAREERAIYLVELATRRLTRLSP